jgi:hypothetical protein
MMRILIIVGIPLLTTAAYGIGMFMFISAVWYKWYPVLQNKLNPTMAKWVVKVGLNGLAGFGGYLYAHYYLNTLTGVDPNNFPKALLALTIPFMGYVWMIFIAFGAVLVALGFMLWRAGIMVWAMVVDFLSLLEVFGFTLPQKKTITFRAFLTYLIGPMGILLCCVLLEGLPKFTPLGRLMNRAATSVLVFADFAHDQTCSASSATRWVAPLKDRKEQDSPKVIVADLSTWPDIQFAMAVCKAGAMRLRWSASDNPTVEANTMADLPPRGLLGTLPADGLLAPGAHNLAIPQAGQGLARVVQDLLGRDDERARVLDQQAAAAGLDAADGEHS